MHGLCTQVLLLLFMQKETFDQVLLGDTDGTDDRAIAAMGILNTLDTIVSVLEEHPEVSDCQL